MEFFYSEDSNGTDAGRANLMAVLEKSLVKFFLDAHKVTSVREARKWKVKGVPTIRINGRDVDCNGGGQGDYSAGRRVYKEGEGLLPAPSKWMILRAMTRVDENPVICYCMDVRKEAIIDALKKGAGTFKDIQSATGASTGNECETKNPAGRCCAPLIIEIVEGWRGKGQKKETEKSSEGG
ncbi:MAG: (2Fe-2S)-binding protein [Thermodesulfobacteriota bacterium]